MDTHKNRLDSLLTLVSVVSLAVLLANFFTPLPVVAKQFLIALLIITAELNAYLHKPFWRILLMNSLAVLIFAQLYLNVPVIVITLFMR